MKLMNTVRNADSSASTDDLDQDSEEGLKGLVLFVCISMPFIDLSLWCLISKVDALSPLGN
jgi:hypothetical protein